jgi:membrane-associated phospholipid phosphatase
MVPQVPFWASMLHLHPNRHRYTFELMGAALRFTMMVVMRFKHALACPRPSEYSPNIQPMILVPGYSCLPSGHATEGTMAKRVLLALTGQADGSPLQLQIDALTRRIAEHRVVAGLHFPIDGEAGFALGNALAGYFLALARRASGHAAWRAASFDGSSGDNGTNTTADVSASITTEAPLLATLWAKAKEEFERDGFVA